MTDYPLKTPGQFYSDNPVVPAATDIVLAWQDGTLGAALRSEVDAYLVANLGVPVSVQAALDAMLGGAPGALDTLDELAAALGDDANFAATVTTALAARLIKESNLSDLPDKGLARSNLGILTRRQYFTSSGTFTVPTGVTEVRFIVSGGGGGGGTAVGSAVNGSPGSVSTVSGTGVSISAAGGTGGLSMRATDGASNPPARAASSGGDFIADGAPGGESSIYRIASTNFFFTSAAGGHAALVTKTAIVTPGAAYTVTVGAGGAGASASGGTYTSTGGNGSPGFAIVEW